MAGGRAIVIKGIIFDLDGVLTDTANLHYLAWQQLADEEQIPFDRKKNEALRGLSRRDSLLKLIGNQEMPEARLESMMARKNHYYQHLIQALGPADLLPGAQTWLKDVRSDGIKIAIASASKNARAVIDRIGLTEEVDAIADGYSVSRPKPAPDLFLFSAQQLDLQPAQCLVVEDSAAGVQASLAGGFWIMGIGPTERVGEADIVIESLAHTNWINVKRQLISVKPPKFSRS